MSTTETVTRRHQNLEEDVQRLSKDYTRKSLLHDHIILLGLHTKRSSFKWRNLIYSLVLTKTLQPPKRKQLMQALSSNNLISLELTIQRHLCSWVIEVHYLIILQILPWVPSHIYALSFQYKGECRIFLLLHMLMQERKRELAIYIKNHFCLSYKAKHNLKPNQLWDFCTRKETTNNKSFWNCKMVIETKMTRVKINFLFQEKVCKSYRNQKMITIEHKIR